MPQVGAGGAANLPQNNPPPVVPATSGGGGSGEHGGALNLQQNTGGGGGGGDFWSGAANWWNDITGQTQKNRGQAAQEEAASRASNATQTLQGIADVGAGTAAQNAIAQGRQLGEEQGRIAATQGTRAATQAARTSGLNAGQAALMGSQRAGDLFTQAQQGGMGQGIGAYQTAQGQRIGAATGAAGAAGVEGGIGTQRAGQGMEQGQNFWGGLKDLAGGIAGLATGLKKGGVVDKPTNAVIGEAGPEAVLPLSDKDRTAEILRKIGLRKGAEEAKAMGDVCPTCGAKMKAKEPEKEPAKEAK